MTFFDGGMATLATIVALSFVAYGGFASLVMIFGSAWRSRQA